MRQVLFSLDSSAAWPLVSSPLLTWLLGCSTHTDKPVSRNERSWIFIYWGLSDRIFVILKQRLACIRPIVAVENQGDDATAFRCMTLNSQPSVQTMVHDTFFFAPLGLLFFSRRRIRQLERDIKTLQNVLIRNRPGIRSIEKRLSLTGILYTAHIRIRG